MTEHHCSLVYAFARNSIFLQCTCGWEHNCGHEITPAEAWALEQRHRAESAGEPRPEVGTLVVPDADGENGGYILEILDP